MDVSGGPHQLWHEYARPFDDGDDRRRTPEFIAQRQPPIDSIDPFNIDHIEVISGATSLYGGGSTGGLINIVTKKGQREQQVELQIGGKTGWRP